MFNSSSPPRRSASLPKAPPPGSIPQPGQDGVPHETVPDWNNIGLFTAGIALGSILGAAIALLWAPASGQETRHRISRRARGLRDDGNVWDDLAKELELAATGSDEEEEEKEEVLAGRKT